jgi:phosphoglycerate-specific signal transduction histidine kinase
MPNNHLADILAFEALQSDQNNRTGMSPMSVFNDANAVRGAVQKYADLKLEAKKVDFDINYLKGNLGRLSSAMGSGEEDEKKKISQLEARSKQLGSSVKQQLEVVKKEIDKVGDEWIQSGNRNIDGKTQLDFSNAIMEPLRGSATFKDDIAVFKNEQKKAMNKYFRWRMK